MAPLGMSFFFTSPAPAGIDVVEAGILNTTQCQKPLPVGASGSYTVMAKLLVSAGAPLQLRDGEILPPLQPNTLATWALFMAEPSATSLLFSVMFCASATEALNPANIATVAANSLCITRSFVLRQCNATRARE